MSLSRLARRPGRTGPAIEEESLVARGKKGKPERKGPPQKRAPGPKDSQLPSPQRPARQAKNPKQPPREEKAAADRPHPGRHHPPRDGL